MLKAATTFLQNNARSRRGEFCENICKGGENTWDKSFPNPSPIKSQEILFKMRTYLTRVTLIKKQTRKKFSYSFDTNTGLLCMVSLCFKCTEHVLIRFLKFTQMRQCLQNNIWPSDPKSN